MTVLGEQVTQNSGEFELKKKIDSYTQSHSFPLFIKVTICGGFEFNTYAVNFYQQPKKKHLCC